MLKNKILAAISAALLVSTVVPQIFVDIANVACAKKPDKKEKEKAQAYYVGGVNMMKGNDIKLAASNFIEAHKLDPENPLYSLFAGDMLAKLKQYPAAIRHYKDSLLNYRKGEKKQRDKIHIKALLGLSDAYAKNNENEAAKITAKELMTEFPDDYRGYLALGRIYARDESTYREAVEVLNRSLDLNREQLPAYLTLAAVFNKAGKMNKVIQVYEMASDYRPLDEAIKMSLAQVYFTYKDSSGQNHYPDAIRVLKSILDVNNNNAFAHYYLSLAYALTNDMQQAEQELAILTELNKNLADRLYHELRAYNEKKAVEDVTVHVTDMGQGEVIALDDNESRHENVTALVAEQLDRMERKT